MMESRTTLDDRIYSAIREKAEAWEVAELSAEEEQEKLSDATTEAFDSIIPRARTERFEYYKSHMFEIALEEKAKEAAFLSDMDRGWGKCLAASKVMYNLAYQSAEAYSNYVAKHKDSFPIQEKGFTFTSLQRICGRACQEYLEIYYLLLNGLADGAFARWRSMYELCCCGQFILINGEETANQYCKQASTNDRSYEWAKSAFQTQKKPPKFVSFEKIQTSIGADDVWKMYYNISCLLNHASPQGTFKRFADPIDIDVISVGQSVQGIAAPAIGASVTLAWACRMFLTLFPTAESETCAFVIDDWLDYLGKMFRETEGRLFPDMNY